MTSPEPIIGTNRAVNQRLDPPEIELANMNAINTTETVLTEAGGEKEMRKFEINSENLE